MRISVIPPPSSLERLALGQPPAVEDPGDGGGFCARRNRLIHAGAALRGVSCHAPSPLRHRLMACESGIDTTA